ncbi:MAG: ATP-binding protein [Abditibacteriota bacterium]|nr:ATP-binding protein [Abditibacteriota bacterium]
MKEYSRLFDTAESSAEDIITYIIGVFSENSFPAEKTNQLRLGIEEAVVNVCNYAYIHNFPVTTGPVEINIKTDGKVFYTEIRDEGIPYNPLKTPNPDLWAPAEEKEIGGLGIYLIKQMTDDISYENDGKSNYLRLTIMA